MKEFINDYVSSISTRRRERVYDLLSEAQLFKSDLDGLVKKLNSFTKMVPITIGNEVPGNVVEGSKFDITFRDLQTRVSELYNISNIISSVLYNNTNILSSEVKALEDELIAIEKLINNFSFGLADGGFYDFSFIETFSDEIMMETFNFSIPDRTGMAFKQDEKASVNTASGVLTLSPNLSTSYGLYGNIQSNNCFGYKTSDTGLDKALNTLVNSGWRVALSSPRPITSTLLEGKSGGAQVALEIFLRNPAPCDMVVLTPFTDLPIEVHSLKVYSKTTDDDYIETVNETRIIDRPTNFNFPMQSVAKVVMVLNQSVYKRNSKVVDKYETQYRTLTEDIKNNRESYAFIKGEKYKRNKKVQRYVFLRSERRRNQFPGFFRSAAPAIDFDVANGPMTLDKILYQRQKPNGQDEMWRGANKTQTIIRRMVYETMFAGNLDVIPDRTVIAKTSSFSGTEIPIINRTNTDRGYPNGANVEPPLDPYMVAGQDLGSEFNLSYDYDIGIKNLQIGSGLSTFNGVFVSKTLPADSDSGEVRIKVSDINFSIANSPRDNPIVTSTEYSVTNRSTPTRESDWLPILPADQTSVTSERFYINEAGLGYFRFPASLQYNIILYKNGYRIPIDTETAYVYATDNQSVLGLNLPISSFQISDIFTCDYTPSGDPTVVNFEKAGVGQSILASAYDESGAGQTFNGTTMDRSVALTYSPYVDYQEVNDNGFYDEDGFQGYQPLTIQFQDGTVAINLTNYKGLTQLSLADYADSSTIYYIHSGKNIMFNKYFTDTFTVYYQYLPSNLRFRTVLRVNDISFVSPVVDFVQIKSKMRKADPRKTF